MAQLKQHPHLEEPYTVLLPAPIHLSTARPPAPTRQPRRRRTPRYLRSPEGAGGAGAGADTAVTGPRTGKAGGGERCVSVSAPVGVEKVCPVQPSHLEGRESGLSTMGKTRNVMQDCNTIATCPRTSPTQDINAGGNVCCRNKDSDHEASKDAKIDCGGACTPCKLCQDGRISRGNIPGDLALSCTYSDQKMAVKRQRRLPKYGDISNSDKPVPSDSPVTPHPTLYHPPPPGSHQEDTGATLEDGDNADSVDNLSSNTGHQCLQCILHIGKPQSGRLCNQALSQFSKPDNSKLTQHLEESDTKRTVSHNTKLSLLSKVPFHVRSRWISVGGCGTWRRQMMLVVYVFLLIIMSGPWRTAEALPVSNMHQWNTIGCIWRSSISPTMPREQVFSPRPECLFGQLWWYDALPGYILRVYFRHSTSGKDFRLCLQHHWKGYVTNIHQQKGEIDALIKPPSEDVESCITSQRGVIELYLEAPSISVYVTVIQYVIRDIEPT